ncbi:hypothetical protein [Pseudoleptotrichia goodfellowii]|uniref:Uncharacterized protein n=1 Tax=Pseudoleptotrichia goodfellowii TaxID=157692 RepID=A0A510J825_9FUSO|nr:hypothetical protein [Pseudoleptotrichia goodfellowii]BBM35408.1 hypothetical protein JCM16774_0320 [Pseudoleptotrichia goodfellowii]
MKRNINRENLKSDLIRTQEKADLSGLNANDRLMIAKAEHKVRESSNYELYSGREGDIIVVKLRGKTSGQLYSVGSYKKHSYTVEGSDITRTEWTTHVSFKYVFEDTEEEIQKFINDMFD